MYKVLIVGSGSYVGDGFRAYCRKHYPGQFQIKTIDSRGLKPEKKTFSGYDSVFYVAGIAHARETKRNAHLYYEVNRDLAVNVAKAAKEAGVRQLILMSTMAVYGLLEGEIGRDTKPKPMTHYGKSKLEADRKISRMGSDDFHVAVLRPPMIYGAGCKGNYQKLRKLALALPIFPKVNNRRSMLYIGNLCEFVAEAIRKTSRGFSFRRMLNM